MAGKVAILVELTEQEFDELVDACRELAVSSDEAVHALTRAWLTMRANTREENHEEGGPRK